MAVTRIKRFSGNLMIDYGYSLHTDYIRGSAAAAGVVLTLDTNGNWGKFDAAFDLNNEHLTNIEVNDDVDYVTNTKYPDLVAVGSCTKANETYAKVKVGGTIKRILVYDDA